MVNTSILSTRILNENDRQVIENSGLNFFEHDFISIATLPLELKSINEAVLFTSQNSVKRVLNHRDVLVLKSKPAFCVGIKTKELLEQNGWKILAWADYAKDLAPIIVEKFPSISISFFNGNLRREMLPEVFKKNKIKFNEFEVYETRLNSKKITQKIDGICFYSPSGIESYLQNNTIVEEVCFCIGDTTASALEGITKKIILAERPTIKATLEACVNYYKSSQF